MLFLFLCSWDPKVYIMTNKNSVFRHRAYFASTPLKKSYGYYNVTLVCSVTYLNF